MRPPCSVVIDTNVLLDWLVFNNAAALPLVMTILERQLVCMASPKMRDELQRMLEHRSLARWSPNAEHALALFDQHVCICAEPAPSALRCTDVDDQVFIDLALAFSCRWLFTRDKALLKLHSRALAHGVRIVTPSAWRAWTLGAAGPGPGPAQ